jgi:predicted SAM-dependent methyltransferase
LHRLHIGGEVAKEGWELLNIQPVEGADHECDGSDLSRFTKQTFDEVYASHVLEHFDYASGMLGALLEWRRVLKWGGKLYISVPDLDVLCKLFLESDISKQFAIMRIIYGGHTDPYDCHQGGLNFNLLKSLLEKAEFSEIEKVDKFGIFEDCSDLPISLNVIARKIRE